MVNIYSVRVCYRKDGLIIIRGIFLDNWDYLEQMFSTGGPWPTKGPHLTSNGPQDDYNKIK